MKLGQLQLFISFEYERTGNILGAGDSVDTSLQTKFPHQLVGCQGVSSLQMVVAQHPEFHQAAAGQLILGRRSRRVRACLVGQRHLGRPCKDQGGENEDSCHGGSNHRHRLT